MKDDRYAQSNDFDTNQKDRILNLLVLKGRCMAADKELREHFFFSAPAMTFYGVVGLAVDCLLSAQLNDEVTACLNERGPLGELIDSVEADARARGVDTIPFKAAVHDLFKLFGDRTEFIIGSTFFDFVVTTFSAFEKFTGLVYDRIRPRYPASNGLAKVLRKLIEKYNATPEADRETILASAELPNGYVSGLNKIEFVLSKLSPIQGGLDIHKAHETVRFYANSRNSIHNLGTSHSKRDFNYSREGIDITHPVGGAMFTPDRSGIIRLCGELSDIYAAIVKENLDLGRDVFVVSEY